MKKNNKKTAQEIQDEIFRKMPADKKIELGSNLWLLAKELANEKVCYRVPWPTKAIPTGVPPTGTFAEQARPRYHSEHGINRSKIIIGKSR